MKNDRRRDRKVSTLIRPRHLIPIAVTIGLISLLFYLRSDRRAIRIMVDHGVDAIESEDRSLLFALVSQSYHDDLGYDRSDVLGIAQDFLDAFDEINVTVESMTIALEGRQATVEVQFKVVVSYEGQRGYLAGAPQTAETIRLGLAREKQGWRVVRADYPRIPRGRT